MALGADCFCRDNGGRGWAYIQPYYLLKCAAGSERALSSTQCLQVSSVDRVVESLPSCGSDPSRGNPIFPLRAVKQQPIDTGLSIAGQPFVLTYDSTSQLPRIFEGPRQTSGTSGTTLTIDRTLIGHGWSASLLDRRVSVGSIGSGATASCTNPAAATAVRGDGRSVLFARTGSGPLTGDGATSDRLEASPGGGYSLRTADARESYDTVGRLLRIDRADGTRLTLTYSDATTPPAVAPGPGYVIEAADNFGRTLRFAYKPPTGALASHLLDTVTDAAGRQLRLGHDSADRLTSVTWTDGAVRTLLYENTAQSRALTGIVDERNARHATFGYDAQGRAISTERAGGAGREAVTYGTAPYIRVTERFDTACNAVMRSFDWVAPQGTTVTSATGAVSNWSSGLVLGRHALTQQSQPAGSGCAASASQQAYDANGNIASRDDFNGNRTCHAHDPGRNLETVRVEGLAGGAACGVTATGAPLPAGSRKVSTQWHPQWALRTRVAEPGRLTTYVYNGQPDPFAGNATATCAPAAATLPDGTPIAVLCRQVEQATSDADGSTGFAAALDGTVPPRTQSWTYNADGQVLTHDGPRTDVADVTTYEYHATTSFTGTDPNAVGVTRGDLKKVTRPNGSSVLYKLYDKLGQLLESEDANGVVSLYAYDARRRLTSITVGGRSIVYEYWPTGLLKRITQPDASWVSYVHDDAHRLVQVSDNLGNSVTYTLDTAGNRTGEQFKDPNGVLRRSLARSIDALGRVQQLTGRE